MTQVTLALRSLHTTALTPRLQQSVRLLQLSSNDFAQELEQALASNPFLEDPQANDPVDAAPFPSLASAENADSSSFLEGSSNEAIQLSPLEGQSSESKAFETALSSPFDATDIDPYEARGGDSLASGGQAQGSSTSESDIAGWAEATTTLRMHLHAELAGYRLEPRDRAVAEMVVEAIDDDGYIRQELGDAVDRLAFDPPIDDEEVRIALALVQQLGPPGIAARSVSECLCLQLVQLDRDGDVDRSLVAIARSIAQSHLDAVAARDWAGLRRQLGCTPTEVTEAVALIRGLDPRPGSRFGGDVAQSIVPDVIVRRHKDGWLADINPAVIPRIGLNQVYAALFRDSHGGDRQPLGQQLQEARWLLRNAAQRFVTIRRVARAIVAEQADFLDYGDIGIRPLLLREVADKLGVHESTISRAIGNKFMATPRGVFAFKHFFSRKLATVSGGSCSATSIRAAMRELIEAEDRSDPMSDVLLARCLGDQGLRVARRTVTKYRGLMRIPPVETRRAGI